MSPQAGILAILASLPVSLGLFFIMMAIGRKIASKRVSRVAGVLGGIGFIASYIFFMSVMLTRKTELMYFSTLGFVPAFCSMGIALGSSNRLLNESLQRARQKNLSAWAKQLAQDWKAHPAGNLIVANSLEKVGDIYLRDLKLDSKAIEAYALAFEIYSRELCLHPQQLDFLRKYHKLLVKTGDTTRAEEVNGLCKKVQGDWQALRGEDS